MRSFLEQTPSGARTHALLLYHGLHIKEALFLEAPFLVDVNRGKHIKHCSSRDEGHQPAQQ